MSSGQVQVQSCHKCCEISHGIKHTVMVFLHGTRWQTVPLRNMLTTLHRGVHMCTLY